MNIVVYSTTVCPVCKRLKEVLKQKNIPFLERNVDEDDEALADCLMLGRWTMPVITVNGKLSSLEEVTSTFKSKD